MTTNEYQAKLKERVEEYFPHSEVKSEWASFKRDRLQYSPRVDITVGPYNTGPGPNLMMRYDTIVHSRRFRRFIQPFYDQSMENLEEFFPPNEAMSLETVLAMNRNSRCLVAIEIENENSRKHIMGSVLNAASLGRVGIGIGFSERSFNAFRMILKYQAFLRQVGKNAYNTSNFLVVTRAQTNKILKDLD